MGTKTCTKCGEEKLSTAEFFHRVRSDASALRSECRACANATSATYLRENKDKNKASCAAWRLDNLERARANSAAWYETNKEKAIATSATWAKNNPEKRKEYTARWREANREKSRAATQAWHDAHPEKALEKAAKYRARKLGATIVPFDEPSLRELLYDLNDYMCAACMSPTALVDMHLDHVVPLSRGGDHAPYNLALLCAPCNLSKGNKTAETWLAERFGA